MGGDSTNINSVEDPSLHHPEQIQAVGLPRKIVDQVLGITSDVAGMSAMAMYHGIVAPISWVQKKLIPIHGVKRDGDEVTRVAIIGAGASGIAAAYTLHKTDGFEFDVYEKNPKIGGHSFTYDFPQKDGKKIPVDMGFIFGHHFSYSNLLEMMNEKGVDHHRADLSLSVEVDGAPWQTDGVSEEGKECPGKMHPNGRSECDRFMALCERNWDNPMYNIIPINWVLKMHGFSETFMKLYMSPVLITLFITEKNLYNYSSRFIFNMFAGPFKFVDIRVLSQCFTVTGGTDKWLQAIARDFKDSIKLNCAVRAVRRITENGKNRVLVESKTGEVKIYDHVIMACNAKTVKMILKNQTRLEEFVFSQIRYETAVTVLHSDTSYLPKGPVGNLNFHHRRKGEHIQLSGNMGVIQNKKLKEMDPVPILTLDPFKEIPEDKVEKVWSGAVHIQDVYHLMITRILLPMIQGNGNIWYGNSWTLWLGHAAAIDTGVLCATRIGGNYPFKTSNSKLFAELNSFDMFGDRFDPFHHTRLPRSKL